MIEYITDLDLEPLTARRAVLADKLVELEAERAKIRKAISRINHILQLAGAEETVKKNGKPASLPTVSQAVCDKVAQTLQMSYSPITAAEISQRSELGRSQVTKALKVLRSQNVVRVAGARPNANGRGRGAPLYTTFREEN